MIKRIFDLILSLLLIAILLPMFLVIGMAVRLDSPGPIFYLQNRVGINGQIFVIYKFRSMHVGAEKSGLRTMRNDSRVTYIGSILRKLSLDELPQLINVVMGDMSLVGPRPNVPAQRTDYSPEHWDLRNSVKPGLTGLAQALVRSAGTEVERLELDLKYIQNASVIFDVYILILTCRQLIYRRGAY